VIKVEFSPPTPQDVIANVQLISREFVRLLEALAKYADGLTEDEIILGVPDDQRSTVAESARTMVAFLDEIAQGLSVPVRPQLKLVPKSEDDCDDGLTP